MVSMFRDRLHTNYVPTDSEMEAISADVASHLLELKDIEQRIDALSARRAELQQYVDAHKALISIPRRLPRDIIAEVFLACLPAPLVLSHICSVWRKIALTAPRLWASLHVPLQFIAADVDRTPILEEWLKRSGACPLSLSIRGESQPEWGETYTEITPCMSTKLLQQPPHKVPLLQSIEFLDNRTELGTFEIGLADRLRCLILPSRAGIESMFSQRPCAVHWERLTHLGFLPARGLSNVTTMDQSMSRFSLPTAFRILACCPRLEHFQFVLNTSTGNFGIGDNLIGVSPDRTSDSLRTLVILEYPSHPHCPDHVWHALPTMPHLESLRLHSAASSFTLGKIFSKMPRLQRLGLSANLYQGLDYFHFLPCITYLELYTTVTENVFDFLTPIPTSEWQTGVGSLGPNPNPNPCPALEELIIATYAPDDVVRNFLCSHAASHTFLRRVSVAFSERRETQVLSPEEMERFKASDITFTYPSQPLVASVDSSWDSWKPRRANGTTGRPFFSNSILAR
ncbi:hypothetical protein C8F01DRAFT_1180448 [Mycena amicta]|nr:hypothetical protein C8F01DRAFT_1180448 [Mycena amicta]